MRFTLSKLDGLKAIAMAVLTPAFTILAQTMANGSLTFDWKAIGTTTVSAVGAYLLKNFLTDDVKAAQKILDSQNKSNSEG